MQRSETMAVIANLEKPKIVAVVGSTAAGKSDCALHLAQKFKGEIISADSVQVYRGLDIGTAKPSPEQRALIPHHLIDILNPDEEYSAAQFRRQADGVIHKLHTQAVPIFLVGGTGLYLKALTRGLFSGPAGNPSLRLILKQKAESEGSSRLHKELQTVDPEAALRIHPRDTLRIIRAIEVYTQTRRPISSFHYQHGFREQPYRTLKIGLTLEKEELYRRIESRCEEMLEKGWVEEVKNLLQKGYSPRLKSLQSLGYRHLVSFLTGNIDLEEAVRLVKRDTRRYAKRQMTWFKADPEIHWFPASPENLSLITQKVKDFFERK